MSALDPSYLRSIRDGILSGNIEANNSEALPDGLVGLYDQELFSPTMKWKERRELLHFFLVFALAQKEISADFAATILEVEWYGVLANENETTEEKCLKKVNEFIQLHSKRFTSAGEGKFRLYHERFRVYILQKNSERDLAQFNQIFISLCESELKKNSEKDIPEKERYALEFLSAHYFISAMQGEKVCLNNKDAASLKNLAYDQTYWERQVKASKGFEWSKKMLNEMMQWASKFDEEEVIECALNKVDLYHQEQNDAPRIVQLVAEGDIEIALLRIEAFGGNDQEGLQRKFILYMLCLMELTLLDSKDKGHTKTSIEKILKYFDEQIPEDYSLLNWSDFFPSYLVFKIAFEIAKLELNYLLLFNRTDIWENSFIQNDYLFDDLQINVFCESAWNISETYLKIKKLIFIFSMLIKHREIDRANSLINETIEFINESSDNEFIASNLVDISKELIKHGMNDKASSLLKKAYDFTLNISDEQTKIHLIISISSEFHLLGKIEDSILLMQEAIKNIDFISDEYSKNLILMNISKELIVQDRIDEALTFSSIISNNEDKNLSLVNMSKEIAKLGKVEIAIECANRVLDNQEKSRALFLISFELAKQGMFESANECTQFINDAYWKISAIQTVSSELAIQGYFEDAIALASLIPDELEKGYAIDLISSQLIEKSNFKLALKSINDVIELLKGTQNNVSKNMLLLNFAISFAQLKMVNESLDLIKLIDFQLLVNDQGNSYGEFQTLLFISSNLYQSGNFNNSNLFIEKAILSLQNNNYEYVDKSQNYSKLSIEFLNRNNIKDATIYFNLIIDNNDKNIVLKQISSKIDIKDICIVLLNSIENKSSLDDVSKVFVINSLAIEFLRKKNEENAFMLNRIINPAFEFSTFYYAVKYLNYKLDDFFIENLYNSAKEIPSIDDSIESLLLFIELLIENKKIIKSKKIKNELLEISKSISKNSSNNLLIEIYIINLLIKDYKEAENVFKLLEVEIKNEVNYWIKSELYSKLVIKMSKTGFVTKAQNIIDLISDDSLRYRSIRVVCKELVKKGEINLALSQLEHIKNEFWLLASLIGMLFEAKNKGVIIEQVQERFDSKIDESIIFDQNFGGYDLLEELSYELFYIQEINKGLIFADKLESLELESFIYKLISIQEFKNSNFENVVKACDKISIKNLRVDNWQNLANEFFENKDFNEVNEIILNFQSLEVRKILITNYINNLKVSKVNKKNVNSILKNNYNNFASKEHVLQMFTINQLFFSNLTQEKLNRYNRTLNLQWAIDIKNQLPN